MPNAVSSSSAPAGVQSLPSNDHEIHTEENRLLQVLAPMNLNDQSVEMQKLIEDMHDALRALRSSDEAHRNIIELISFTAKPLVIQAMFSNDVTESARCAAEIKKIFDQITEIAEDSHNAYLEYSTS